MLRSVTNVARRVYGLPAAGFAVEFQSEGARASPLHASKKRKLKQELRENPEFDKAFPHLAQHKPLTKITRPAEEFDFIDSLLQHDRVPEDKTIDENNFKNYQNFAAGFRVPDGPLKDMKPEQKARIHELAEAKLQELEDTGLSREEILYDDRTGGISLKMDPFFQHIKKSRVAREILFAPNSEFTAAKIVELALRQDIGPDPSLARDKTRNLMEHEISDTLKVKFLKGQVTDAKKFESTRYSALYDSQFNPPEGDIKEHDKMPIPMPKTRAEVRNRTLRKIDWNDIHWRNTELLANFLSNSGTIKSRYQTRLPANQQKAIAKAIKSARQMAMLPTIGYIKPTDKMSLTTLQEDVERHIRTRINMETGGIYIQETSDEPVIENPYNVEDPENFDEEGYSQIQDLDVDFVPMMPNAKEIKILKAQAYAKNIKRDLLEKSGEDLEALHKAAPERKLAVSADVDFSKHGAEMGTFFAEIETEVKNARKEGFASQFLGEKAMSSEIFESSSIASNDTNADLASKLSQKSKQELQSELGQLRRQLGLDSQ